jgi:hypothetical protein
MRRNLNLVRLSTDSSLCLNESKKYLTAEFGAKNQLNRLDFLFVPLKNPLLLEAGIICDKILLQRIWRGSTTDFSIVPPNNN